MEFNGTFFATIISFIVFVFLMNKILYKPILNIMSQRKDFIEENLSSAHNNNEKAESLIKKREEGLNAAKEDAREKYNEVLSGYKNERAEIIQNAQSVNNTELENAYSELENVSNEAKEGLKNRMTDLANDIVEKVLGYRSEIQGFDNDKVNEILYGKEG